MFSKNASALHMIICIENIHTELIPAKKKKKIENRIHNELVNTIFKVI